MSSLKQKHCNHILAFLGVRKWAFHSKASEVSCLILKLVSRLKPHTSHTSLYPYDSIFFWTDTLQKSIGLTGPLSRGILTQLHTCLVLDAGFQWITKHLCNMRSINHVPSLQSFTASCWTPVDAMISLKMQEKSILLTHKCQITVHCF